MPSNTSNHNLLTSELPLDSWSRLDIGIALADIVCYEDILALYTEYFTFTS